MPEILELRSDCLDSPSRWDLAIIEAQMIWPEDPSTRARYLEAVATKLTVDSIDRRPLAKPTPTEVKDLAERILEAPRIADFREFEPRFRDGLIAGTLLYQAIGYHEIEPKKAGLTEIKKGIAKNLWRQYRVSAKLIDNKIWRTFRPVSHLWAAYLQHRLETGDWIFPCRLTDLGIFLAVADEYRRRGETVRSSAKAPSTVLRLGDSVIMPPGLPLQKIELVCGVSAYWTDRVICR